MSGGKQYISNRQANVGSGVAGVGLGTAVVAVVPMITQDESILKFAQYLAPSISVAGAFLSKVLINYSLSWLRLRNIAQTTKRIGDLVKDETITDDYKEELVNKKQALHREEIKIMSSMVLNEFEDSQLNIEGR